MWVAMSVALRLWMALAWPFLYVNFTPSRPAVYLPLMVKPADVPGIGVRFAVIGDFGAVGTPAQAVAALVKGWQPAFIITTGDNNYPDGAAGAIDANIGRYYHEFIYPYTGSYGKGATVNRFFPSLGNHDWYTPGAQPYLNYFALPGNERYYAFTWGPVRLYALDSDPHEPDGVTDDSIQAMWLQAQLAASDACWNLVYFHHPPYGSGGHGSTTYMQWPFAAWGADAVLAGHNHQYERLARDGILYFVNGLGGHPNIYPFGEPLEGSQVRYGDRHGAMRVAATRNSITYEFLNVDGEVIDTVTVTGGCVDGGAP